VRLDCPYHFIVKVTDLQSNRHYPVIAPPPPIFKMRSELLYITRASAVAKGLRFQISRNGAV
jgi:hypothetical protein